MASYINLPADLLRNFVAIVDAGSMSKAADEICLTQSALSLQMKRIAELIQAPVFSRHHRGMLLTDAGKTLLEYARVIIDLNDRAVSSITGATLVGPIRIGMTQDFADDLLSNALVRMMQVNPNAEVQICVGSSTELVGQITAGLLDIVLCLAAKPEHTAVATAPMEWIGHSNLTLAPVLPIALMARPCIFRDAALDALNESGRRYKIVLETHSISVLKAAVAGGVAVTCRTDVMGGTCDVGRLGIEIPLPRVCYCVHTGANASPQVLQFAQIFRNAILRIRGVGRPGANEPAQDMASPQLVHEASL